MNTAPPTVRVWDCFVRLFHWSLVASFVVAWLSAESRSDLHHWAGYAAAALIGFRLIWGFTGSHYALFRQFVRRPSTVMQFGKAMLRHEEPRYIGHNPAGSLMILGLIIAMAVTGITGWMYTLDALWGVEWVEEVHETTAELMLIMILLHVLGVIYAGYQHKENLVRSMISGRKRSPEPGDVA